MRHTKIIATVGPASDSDAMLDALIAAGTDIFRLNFSHGTHESQARDVRARPRGGRSAPAATSRSCRISAGRKSAPARSKADGRSRSKPGDTLRIATGDFAGGPGPHFDDVRRARAAACSPAIACCSPTASSSCASTRPTARRSRRRSSKAATLGEHKGINAPGVPLPASAITPKDVDDLQLRPLAWRRHGRAQLRADRRRPARRRGELMIAAGRADVPLVAKLERPQALEHLDEILAACDGVMVARGDLGLEMPLERVPRGAEGHHAPRAAPRHPGDRRDAGARVDDAPSRGRRAPKSATPPTRWTTASTRSCWRARPPPARFRRAPSRRSTRSSATPSPAQPAHAGRQHRRQRRSRRRRLCEAAVTLAEPRRARGDRRRHARRQHGAAAVGAAPARADHRRLPSATTYGAAADAVLGRGADVHRRSARTSTRRAPWSAASSWRAASCRPARRSSSSASTPTSPGADANYLKVQKAVMNR